MTKGLMGMFIEWAVLCSDYTHREDGYAIKGVGLSGYLCRQEDLPKTVEIPVLLCIRLDSGDQHGTTYDFAYQVKGPDGLQTAQMGGFEHRMTPGPALVTIERYFFPI